MYPRISTSKFLLCAQRRRAAGPGKAALIILCLLTLSTPLTAKPLPSADVVRKIEMRRGLWVNLQATLKMDFTTPQGKKASCRAELVYDRLDEKILLKGFNDKSEPLFVFKTDDRNFELYLPRQNTVFSGSIFDLEDSPEIHSHLKALDLYRSLKPMALPLEKTTADEDQGLTRLEIRGAKGKERALYANAEGDTVKEVYYRKDGMPKTLVERSNFKPVKKGKRGAFSFPEDIRIESYPSASAGAGRGTNETRLKFVNAEFSPLNSQAFDFVFPENARRADIGGEFKKQQALASR